MENKFYSNVFMWLFVGLLLTFGLGYMASVYLPLAVFALNNYYIFAIAQIIICIVLSVRIAKMNPNTAKALYLGYTMLTGLTFSSLFLIFEIQSIMFVFLATAIVFGIFALIGYTTKKNLNKIGIYLLIGLLAIIILEIINIFIMNESLDLGLCIVGIVIFVGYIAYDMQKIKRFAEMGGDNLAILGAFELYLDFINLFIKLLNLTSRNRD